MSRADETVSAGPGAMRALQRHTLSVLVENTPGVLARVSSLFSRRGFNIESLAVGETDDPSVSRMTVVLTVDEAPLEQVTKQLHKLINVLKIVELDEDSVERGLVLVKVRADPATRGQVLDTLSMFRARVVDVAPDTVTVEAVGSVYKLDRLLAALEPFGIRELVKSGVIALARGSRAITDRPVRPVVDRSA